MIARRRQNARSGGWWDFARKFFARVGSSDEGLYFEAVITYRWELTEGEEDRVLHPDEVARSLLTDSVAKAVCDHPVLHVVEAEREANKQLSQAITVDSRIRVTGGARLDISPATGAEANARAVAAHQIRVEAAAETARLEVLRERLLSRGLGLLWWFEQHGGFRHTDGDPQDRTGKLIKSYRDLTNALSEDTVQAQEDGMALIRARMSELIRVFEDPELAPKAARYLQEYLTIVGREQR